MTFGVLIQPSGMKKIECFPAHQHEQSVTLLCDPPFLADIIFFVKFVGINQSQSSILRISSCTPLNPGSSGTPDSPLIQSQIIYHFFQRVQRLLRESLQRVVVTGGIQRFSVICNIQVAEQETHIGLIVKFFTTL